MKLKNKISGEIKEFSLFDGNELQGGATLESLTKEWEDAPEEPKKYWFLSGRGEVKCIEDEKTVFDKDHKFIGNYFETKEEAEKAVEKLKAWKRLKGKGFKIKGWYMPKSTLKIEIDGGFPEDVSLCDVMDDLDIIFGGEE